MLTHLLEHSLIIDVADPAGWPIEEEAHTTVIRGVGGVKFLIYGS